MLQLTPLIEIDTNYCEYYAIYNIYTLYLQSNVVKILGWTASGIEQNAHDLLLTFDTRLLE